MDLPSPLPTATEDDALRADDFPETARGPPLPTALSCSVVGKDTARDAGPPLMLLFEMERADGSLDEGHLDAYAASEISSAAAQACVASCSIRTPKVAVERDADGDVWSLNQYNVIATLGRGASATVYLVDVALPDWNPVFRKETGRHEGSPPPSPLAYGASLEVSFGSGWGNHPQEFAVKVIPRRRVLPSLGAAARSEANEVAMMLRFPEHPHIVTLHEVIDDAEQDTLFLVLDYVDGGVIGEVDPATGRIGAPLGDTELELFYRQQLSALAHVHHFGVVHGDYKLENVLRSRGSGDAFTTKLSDFGVASELQSALLASRSFSRSLTLSPLHGQLIVGTPYIRAPELFDDASPSCATDAWAFGVALFTAAFGEAPFHSTSLVHLADLVRRPARPPPSADAARVARWWPRIAPLLVADPIARLQAFRAAQEL